MKNRKINKTEQPIPYEELMKGQRPCPEAKALLSQAPADRVPERELYSHFKYGLSRVMTSEEVTEYEKVYGCR